MARDRASIRIDMWADEDWRGLSLEAQHLYMLLLSHPTLSYAGVADWRAGRIAAMTSGRTAEEVADAASQLEKARFVLADDSTEEILVRSFVKHDGLMKQPKLVVSLSVAFAAIASSPIRQVAAYEIQKLHAKQPDLKWGVRQVQTILDATGTDIAEFTQGFTPAVTPSFTLNDGQGQGLPTATATATATASPSGKRPSLRISDDWVPTASHFEKAKTLNIDITREVENFRGHAATHDRHAANWNAAFTTWLGKATPTVKKLNPNDEWMRR